MSNKNSCYLKQKKTKTSIVDNAKRIDKLEECCNNSKDIVYDTGKITIENDKVYTILSDGNKEYQGEVIRDLQNGDIISPILN